MYIERANADEIPKDAIRMTRDEVHQYISDRIQKWPNTLEIWALKYGNPILSSAVVVTSSFILNFYRSKLKLRNYGRFTLFLPVVLTPSIFNQLFQINTTTRSIILQDDCPICIATQSMLIQFGTGIIYPLMSSIGGTYMFAHKMNTVAFSGKNGIDIAQKFAMHLLKTSQPLYNRLTVFVVGNLLLSYAITYYQTENLEFLKFIMFEQYKEELEEFRQNKENKNNLLNN